MKIYIIGDSISIQYGPYLQECLRGKMEYARKEGTEEALLNLDRPVGANGGDSSMVLEFLKESICSDLLDADLLLINCGLHDIKTDPTTHRKQIPIDDYAENLKSIVEFLAATPSRLIWIRTTPCDESVHNRPGMEMHRFVADCDAYNAVADRIVAEADVPSIDLHAFTLSLGPDLYCDHVHFHEHVRQRQAEFIADWLTEYEESRACP
jgi:lysophospholipase L1-like esterase